MPKSLERKFLESVEVDQQTDCWLWTRSKNPRSGYGSFNDGYGVRSAHRVAYEHFIDKVPKGLELGHTCKNKCANPTHVRPVTHTQNVNESLEEVIATMVRFKDVDPDEVPNLHEGSRGRVSYPILKSFLETGKYIAMLDRTSISGQPNLQTLQASLRSYIKTHGLPVKMFVRRGEIYFTRLDIDEEGNFDPDWQQHAAEQAGVVSEANAEPVPLDTTEVEQRYKPSNV